jgi:dTDP-4-amino-4,6-dideoxygalactose transaminase
LNSPSPGQKILGVFHYQSLHLFEMGQEPGGCPGQCPVTESVSHQLLRLPLYCGLTEAEQTEVIDTLLSFSTD